VERRELKGPIFDADNHFYESREALTKYLPEAYGGAIRYVEIDGRTKMAVRGQISDYIPNPTFERRRGSKRTISGGGTRKEGPLGRSWVRRSRRFPPFGSPGRAWS
jgi:hypothetical protein